MEYVKLNYLYRKGLYHMHILKKLSKYIPVFVIVTLIEFCSLTLSAAIPISQIQTNMEESADYLISNQMFFFASKQDHSSKIDRYADSILLNITYSMDYKNPVTSAMQAAYYYTDTSNENHNFYNAVYHDKSPNWDYSRYWHGSISILRPLFTIFNLKQIYIGSAIILLFLYITLLFFTKKYINFSTCISLLIASIMTSVWYVPMSLEYTWTFVIMLAASILCMALYREKEKYLPIIFFITGSTTCYLDFLTTETITLLVPLILIFALKQENKHIGTLKTEFLYAIKISVNWLAGYALTWLSKWTLASVILHENVFSGALAQASYRVGGATDKVSGISEIIQSILRNISCIFPFSFISRNGYVAVIIFFVIVTIILYVFKKKKTSSTLNTILCLIAIIPFVRFIVLSNHSYLHYFFTYRALISTIFCLGLLFAYNFDFNYLKRKGKLLWRKK